MNLNSVLASLTKDYEIMLKYVKIVGSRRLDLHPEISSICSIDIGY